MFMAEGCMEVPQRPGTETSPGSESGARVHWGRVGTWGAPAQTGKELWMKEPYEEGVANRFDPESCVVTREGEGEALTGARAGWVLSHEITRIVQGADAVLGSGRPHRAGRNRETRLDPAWSETPCMYGNSLRGSREISRLATADSAGVRVVNPTGTRWR